MGKTCKYCRKQIDKKAKKCEFCGELIGFRGFLRNNGNYVTCFNILISLGLLSMAYLHYHAREKAVRDKEIIKSKLESKNEILRKMPRENISKAAREDLKPKRERRFETVFPDEESREEAKKIEELILKGDESLEAGRGDVAQQFYLEAARLERASPLIRQTPETLVPKAVGYSYIERGEPERAREEFEKALRRNPRDIEAQRGAAYSEILGW
ncbi:hypothetical protein ES705_03739 [subsurface metagenome]